LSRSFAAASFVVREIGLSNRFNSRKSSHSPHVITAPVSVTNVLATKRNRLASLALYNRLELWKFLLRPRTRYTRALAFKPVRLWRACTPPEGQLAMHRLDSQRQQSNAFE
jgi:hypothetical protein